MKDKAALFRRLVAELASELRAMEHSQRITQEGAVHPEAKQEGDKDTRATESQYLARGLAMRVEELREAVGTLNALDLRPFDDDDPIALTALVTLEDESGHVQQYFLAPTAGGRKLGEATVITIRSPIGRALLGKRNGDEVVIRTPKGTRSCEIVALH